MLKSLHTSDNPVIIPKSIPLYDSLFIDLEWFINQDIFLIGWAHSKTVYGQLYGNAINIKNIENLFNRTKKHIFFFGPDIGMIEKTFKKDFRHKYHCVNLLKVFKDYYPDLESHKLAHFEKIFGIERETMKYKTDIFQMIRDWKNPKKRKMTMIYNMEDVINMLIIKNKIFKAKKITDTTLLNYRLQ